MLYRKNSNCKISSDIEEDYSCMCVTIVRVATDFIIIVEWRSRLPVTR